jgi:hypothetical protein
MSYGKPVSATHLDLSSRASNDSCHSVKLPIDIELVAANSSDDPGADLRCRDDGGSARRLPRGFNLGAKPGISHADAAR